jgi:acyl-CoA synthetase (AMP-forming)/AMP-acid ligase II
MAWLMGAVARRRLLVVPMFHVNAWGMPYAGAMSGVQAGDAGSRRSTASSVYDLMRDEKVTLALGVPTVWLMLLQHVDAEKLQAQGRTDACGASSSAARRRRAR